MTPRMVTIYGLLSGISPREGAKLSPGFILDAFMLKRKYDASLRGIRW